MPEENLYPRWPVINECIRALDDTLVNISKQLINLKEYPISVDEVEVCLKQLQKTIDRARVRDWLSEEIEEKPSPQMSAKPRGLHYG